MPIIYTDEQERLIHELIKWYRDMDKPYFSYSGGPGTGKTTVIKEFIRQMNFKEDEYIGCAYVGKAVLNLLQHDVNAVTLHSLIYHTTIERVKEEDDYGEIKYKTKMKFELRESLKNNYKLIIVDEAPMINDKMINELLSFGVPVVFIGDTDQLPPIFGVSSVMQNPDFKLTKIMRQSEDDPIVYLSRAYLNGETVPYGNYGLSKVVEEYPLDKTMLTDFDQILCGKNATRDNLNNDIRMQLLHRAHKDPVIGDKIICRQNNWDIEVQGIYLTNGLIGEVTDISRVKANQGYYKISFMPDFMDKEFEDIKLDLKYMRAPANLRKDWGISKYEKFEYGYAITTHLSQGSEYNRVLFFDEWFYDQEFLRRLRYTAISRAKKYIDIVIARPKQKIWTF